MGDAVSDDDLPHPVWSGSFMLGGVEMKCHVLSNGQRIIEAESIHSFFSAFGDEAAPEVDDAELEKFVHWQRGTA